jgi:cytoskeletal protein RodZ
MDWQQLQSLYNQKQSVEHTGTLVSEKNSPTMLTSHRPWWKRRFAWLALLALVVIVGLVGILWYAYHTRVTKNPPVVLTTENATPEQVRQAMIDEVVAESQKVNLSPDQMQAILSGTQ